MEPLGCRKGAWAELTTKVTSVKARSKRNAHKQYSIHLIHCDFSHVGIFYIQNLPWPVFYKNRDRRISKIPPSPFFILCQILTPAILQLHLLLSVLELPSYRSAVHLSMSMHIQDKLMSLSVLNSLPVTGYIRTVQ